MTLLGINLGRRAELRVGTEDQVGARRAPAFLPPAAVIADELLVAARVDDLPDRVHVEQVDEEVVGELAHPVGEHAVPRSEEHTSELQSLMRRSYAVFCLKKKNTKQCEYTTQQYH